MENLWTSLGFHGEAGGAGPPFQEHRPVHFQAPLGRDTLAHTLYRKQTILQASSVNWFENKEIEEFPFFFALASIAQFLMPLLS